MKATEFEIILLRQKIETHTTEVQQLESQMSLVSDVITFQEAQAALCESESAKLTMLKTKALAHHGTLCNHIGSLSNNDMYTDYFKDSCVRILYKVQDIEAKDSQKVSAWENEIRDLQDRTQLKQFKIDKFEQQVAKI